MPSKMFKYTVIRIIFVHKYYVRKFPCQNISVHSTLRSYIAVYISIDNHFHVKKFKVRQDYQSGAAPLGRILYHD